MSAESPALVMQRVVDRLAAAIALAGAVLAEDDREGPPTGFEIPPETWDELVRLARIVVAR